MILIKFIIAFALTFYIGICIERLLIKTKIPAFLFFISAFLIGMGAISLQMMLYSFVNINWSLLNIVAPWFIFIPSFLKEKYYFKHKFDLRLVKNPLILLLLMITVVQLILISIRFFIHPGAIGYDAIDIWYYKANAFFIDKTVDFSLFTNPLLGQSKLADTFIRSSYPIFLPLYLAFVFLSIGKFSIFFGNLIWLFLFLLIVFLIYKYLSKTYDASYAVLGVFLFISLPANFDHLAGRYAGYADLILLCFVAVSTVFLMYWIKNRKTTNISLALLLSAFAANIKTEGLVFFLLFTSIFILDILLKRKKIKYLKILFLPFSIVFPWYFIASFKHFPSFLDKSSGLHIQRLLVIVLNIFLQFINIENFILLTPLFIFCLILGLNAKFIKQNLYLLLLIFGALLSYIIFFMITPLDPVRHINSLADRMLYSISPVLIIFISQSLWSYYKK